MSDAVYMARSLALAALGRGRTAPNPMVGCVIVGPDGVLAEGWHHAPGQAHGEVDALSKVGGRAPGATLYVNLEPCCHYGRTPPCTDAVLASGVRRVVVAMVDPDSRVSGRGLQILRNAGLQVEVGLMEAEARRLNAAYLTAAAHRRPRVTLKAGITLDGRIASAAGESRWITGEAARAAAHALRDVHDAVLVGSGTVLADNPALNTRVPGGRDALPVLLDTHGRLPADAAVLSAGRRPLVYTGPDAPALATAADQARVARDADGRLDLRAVLQDLHRRGVHALLVEGGGQVHRSFLDLGLADQVELFVSGRILAGGPGWVGGAPYPLAAAPHLRVVGATPVGEDLQITLEPA